MAFWPKMPPVRRRKVATSDVAKSVAWNSMYTVSSLCSHAPKLLSAGLAPYTSRLAAAAAAVKARPT